MRATEVRITDVAADDPRPNSEPWSLHPKRLALDIQPAEGRALEGGGRAAAARDADAAGAGGRQRVGAAVDVRLHEQPSEVAAI